MCQKQCTKSQNQIQWKPAAPATGNWSLLSGRGTAFHIFNFCCFCLCQHLPPPFMKKHRVHSHWNYCDARGSHLNQTPGGKPQLQP